MDRLEGRPAVLSIELSDSLDRDQLVAAACALRDAIGSSGSVYRVGVSDFAVITRAHHEHFLADLIASCQSALIDDELLRSGGAMVGASRFGGAIHDGVMSAAELAGQAVMSRPQSGAADDREYALH